MTTGKKKIIKIVCIVLAIWLALLLIDLAMVAGGNKPVFCLGIITADDGGSGLYYGLGYGFDIKGNFMPEDTDRGVTSYTMYLLFFKVLKG